MSEDQFVIYASNRGYWRPKSCGYTINPDIAGRYTKTEAEDILSGHGPERLDKMYALNSTWFKRRRKEYLQEKIMQIQCKMETMTSDQVIEILPELFKIRKERNG